MNTRGNNYLYLAKFCHGVLAMVVVMVMVLVLVRLLLDYLDGWSSREYLIILLKLKTTYYTTVHQVDLRNTSVYFSDHAFLFLFFLFIDYNRDISRSGLLSVLWVSFHVRHLVLSVMNDVHIYRAGRGNHAHVVDSRVLPGHDIISQVTCPLD